MSQRFAVSVKGVVIRGSQVVLLRNERDEWELPGGKLEVGETPEACVAREIEEELGLAMDARSPDEAWSQTPLLNAPSSVGSSTWLQSTAPGDRACPIPPVRR